MILQGKYLKASRDYKARRAAYDQRRRAVHDAHENVVYTPLPEFDKDRYLADMAVAAQRATDVAMADIIAAPPDYVGKGGPRKGVCPNCGRVFKSGNVPHFHARACK